MSAITLALTPGIWNVLGGLVDQLPFALPPTETKEDWKEYLYLHERQQNCQQSWLSVDLPCEVSILASRVREFAANLPCKEISREERRYVERYYLPPPAPRSAKYVVHRFLSSDPVSPHDHPWEWAVSIQLSGECTEQRLRDRTNYTLVEMPRRAGCVSLLRPTDYHRVVLGTQEVWTLFTHPPDRCQGWGFLQPGFDWVDFEGRRSPAHAHIAYDLAIERPPEQARFRSAELGHQVWKRNNEM